MKNLSYFEKKADALRAGSFDYNLISRADLILSLMKQYKKDNGITWSEYKKTFDKYFNKYH